MFLAFRMQVEKLALNIDRDLIINSGRLNLQGNDPIETSHTFDSDVCDH